MDKAKLKGFKEGMEKDASGIVTAYGIPGAVIGAIRAGNLSKEDKETLRKYYSMKGNSKLKTRNSMRGLFGGAGGGLAGGLAGGGLAGAPGTALGGIIGAIGGTYAATNKYSKGRALKLKNKN